MTNKLKQSKTLYDFTNEDEKQASRFVRGEKKVLFIPLMQLGFDTLKGMSDKEAKEILEKV